MTQPPPSSPFHLDAAALTWVETTLAGLNDDQKLAQLFNLLCMGENPEQLARLQALQPGSITRKAAPDAKTDAFVIKGFNDAAPVPLLVSADVEGSRMSIDGGVEMPNPLAVAAVHDLQATASISRLMAKEAASRGINWSFTPVVDINAQFRSAIVATRGFGADVETIQRHAIAQLQAFQTEGVAATVKHWPGEGFDDRDQHLMTTINPLNMDVWEQYFGRLYRAAIEAGVMSVMSAHIALPSYILAQVPDAGLEAYRPASVSKRLNQDLLRDTLGFQGLIVSDATPMAGLTAWSHRSQHLPEIIASGCDVILFSNDMQADLGYLKAALDDGRLRWDRVNDAVHRQLQMKAALGLHNGQSIKGAALTKAEQQEITAFHGRVPTLVKDVQNLLPLSPAKHKRVLVITPGIIIPFTNTPLPFSVPKMLQEQGFETTAYEKGMVVSADDFDLVLYLFGDETLLTRGRIFLDWRDLHGGFGPAMQRFWHDIPTAMISFGYPYMLYDAPRVPTYINAYCTTDSMQAAVVQALLGHSPWNSNSPVDAFCGLKDTRY